MEPESDSGTGAVGSVSKNEVQDKGPKAERMSEQSKWDRLTARDIGKGLLLLALVILLSYFALAIISPSAYVEANWKTWTLPSMLVGTLFIASLLAIVGLILLRLGRASEAHDEETA